jgi:hypothetical protein
MTFARPTPTQQRQRRAAEKKRNLKSLSQPSRALKQGCYSGGTSGEAVAKEDASQSAAYMAAVRALGYCMRCGCTLKKGEAQFAHADQGKGMGIKTDARRGWCACAGCHFHVGTSGRMPKAERRDEEDRLAFKTRALVRKAGTWPKALADWPEE